MQINGPDNNFITSRLPFETLLQSPSISEAGRRSLLALKEDLQSEKYEFITELKRRFGGGIEICITGGAVRDAIMGVQPKDIDLLISFPGFRSHAEAQSAFEAFFGEREYKKTASGEIDPDEWHIYSEKWGKLIIAGEKFGVYKLHLKGTGETIDIAFPRTETAADGEARGGRRAFEVQSDALMPIEKDLYRRDFTFNSMCLVVDYDFSARSASRPPTVISFIDLFSGLSDCLDKKLIRTTNKPEVTFRDDLSRIFRAVRFSCRFGFDIDEAAWKAIGALARNINKKNDNGNYILKRETLSAELIKSFCLDPLKAFDLLMRPLPSENASAGNSPSSTGALCLLEIVFPHLFNEIRFSGSDKSYIASKHRQWYEITFGAGAPPPEELEESRTIKLKALSRVREMFRLAAENNIILSPAEIFAVLFHDSGETKKLEKIQKKKNRCIYPYSHSLSSMIWNRSYSNLKMASLPAGNEKYAVNKNEVARIINGIYTMYTLLGECFDRQNLTLHEIGIKILTKLTSLLTGGINDSLLNIFRLDANATETVTETARKRADNLIEFADKWFESVKKIEEKIGCAPEKAFEIVFSTKIIADIFMLKQGPVYSELEKIAYTYYISYLYDIFKRRIARGGSGTLTPEINKSTIPSGFDALEAREKIFYELVRHSPLRKEWESLLTPELYSCFSPFETPEESAGRLPDGHHAEEARRELLYVIERTAYFRYVGPLYSGRASKKSGRQSNKNMAPARKKGAAFTRKFIESMHENPVELMEMIERHSRRPDERKKKGGCFFDIVTPWLTSMIGVEQPAKYHSEGDVWEHTKKCARRSLEIRAEKNLNARDYAALAAAVMFHDSGKPAAKDVGEKGQICFYGHEELSAKEFAAFAGIFGLDEDACPVFAGNYSRVIRAIENHSAVAQKISALKNSSRASLAAIIDIFPDGSEDISYYLYLCDSAATIGESGISKADECREQTAVLEKLLRTIDRYKHGGVSLAGLLNDGAMLMMTKDKSSKVENLSLLDAYCDFLEASGQTGFSEKNTAAFLEWTIKTTGYREFAARYIQKKASLADLAFESLSRPDNFRDEPEKVLRSQARKLTSSFIQNFDLSSCLKEDDDDFSAGASEIRVSFMKWLNTDGKT